MRNESRRETFELQILTCFWQNEIPLLEETSAYENRRSAGTDERIDAKAPLGIYLT